MMTLEQAIREAKTTGVIRVRQIADGKVIEITDPRIDTQVPLRLRSLLAEARTAAGARNKNNN